jgi:hypothetical protein
VFSWSSLILCISHLIITSARSTANLRCSNEAWNVLQVYVKFRFVQFKLSLHCDIQFHKGYMLMLITQKILFNRC